VTDSDSFAVDRIIILRCPACGTCEAADAAVLSDDPTIVCRQCGNTWPAAPPRVKRQSEDGLPTDKDPGREATIEAAKRPLISYSDGLSKAWAAKVEGDYWPEPSKEHRALLVALATVAALFMTIFVAAREAAVAALPDLAGLYAVIGLPVNLDGIEIEAVAAERGSVALNAPIVVHGQVRNVRTAREDIPHLAVVLRDDAGTPQRTLGFALPQPSLGAGDVMPFELDIQHPPAGVAQIAVRFQRRGESLPPGGEAIIAP